MSPGREAFLRLRELERRAQEALDADDGGAEAWAMVRGDLRRVYRGEALPGSAALRNLSRPLYDLPVDERSLRRVGDLATDFGSGLGLPPGSWAAGPAAGWTEALAEVAGPWLASASAVDRRARPPSPRPIGWTCATGLSSDEGLLREALEADPRGEQAALVLDVVLAPLYAELVPPTTLDLAPLTSLDLEPQASERVNRLERELATGFTTRDPQQWGGGSPPGWDEALAERAPFWLAAAAERRAVAARVGLALPEPAPPTLHDAPGFRDLLQLRELEQRLRIALTTHDDVLRLDSWLRPLYDGSRGGTQEPGPLALSAAAEQAAALAVHVRGGLATEDRGWRAGMVAVAPAWLAAAELRARPPEGPSLLERLRSGLRRGGSA